MQRAMTDTIQLYYLCLKKSAFWLLTESLTQRTDTGQQASTDNAHSCEDSDTTTYVPRTTQHWSLTRDHLDHLDTSHVVCSVCDGSRCAADVNQRRAQCSCGNIMLCVLTTGVGSRLAVAYHVVSLIPGRS